MHCLISMKIKFTQQQIRVVTRYYSEISMYHILFVKLYSLYPGVCEREH